MVLLACRFIYLFLNVERISSIKKWGEFTCQCGFLSSFGITDYPLSCAGGGQSLQPPFLDHVPFIFEFHSWASSLPGFCRHSCLSLLRFLNEDFKKRCKFL